MCGVVFAEAEDGFDVAFGFVVCEERGVGCVPAGYYIFSLLNIYQLLVHILQKGKHRMEKYLSVGPTLFTP